MPIFCDAIQAVIDDTLAPVAYTPRFPGIAGYLFPSECLRLYRSVRPVPIAPCALRLSALAEGEGETAVGNVEKTMTAPVTVIVAYDLKFYEKLSKLFPHKPAMRDIFARNPQLVETTAKRNSSLQGAYLTLAAWALGLDCGPMSGFDNAKTASRNFFLKVMSIEFPLQHRMR